MRGVSIVELVQQISQVMDWVRSGEAIEITDDGVLVAEIRPVSPSRSVLARLEAEGRLTPATLDPSVLHLLPKGPPDGLNLADLMAADREQERF